MFWGQSTLVVNVLTAGFLGIAGITPTLAQPVPGGAEAGRVEQRFDHQREPQVRPRVSRGLESTVAPSEAAAISITLEAIEIVGSTIYDDATLSEFYADLIGETVTLAQIFDVAAQITARYGNDGFFLSRAIVPPQALDEGGATIRIQIIEGYFDNVEWPEGLLRYRDFFTDYAAAITAERPINIRTLERYLLLANDLPGLEFDSNLTASPNVVGASTLVLTFTEDPYDVFAAVDNHGVEASGPYQGTIGGALNNRLGFHERIQGAFIAAGPSEKDHELELEYASWEYEQVLTAEGLTFFHDGNWNNGAPGTNLLVALAYQTAGLNLSGGFSYPFIRTREENLTGTIAFDFKNSESATLGVLATEDRLRIVRAELAYEKADEYRGTNQITLTAHQGIDGMGSTGHANPLASRNPGRVDFLRATGEIARTQQLANRFSLYLAAFGQWTNDPVLAP